MIRNGLFGIYNSHEYEIVKDMYGNNYIITTDERKIDNTFVDTYHTGVYRKKVILQNLRDVYFIKTTGFIDNTEVEVLDEYEDMYCIRTLENDLVERFKLKPTDKGYERFIYKDYLSRVHENKIRTF